MKGIEKKLWDHCKRIIRKRYGNVCYTCGRSGLESSNWHTGHLFPKATLSAFLKYDLRVLRPQCYNCNINYGGHGAVFYTNMLKREGKVYMNQLEFDRNITVKASDHYKQLLAQYEKIDG